MVMTKLGSTPFILRNIPQYKLVCSKTARSRSSNKEIAEIINEMFSIEVFENASETITYNNTYVAVFGLLHIKFISENLKKMDIVVFECCALNYKLFMKKLPVLLQSLYNEQQISFEETFDYYSKLPIVDYDDITWEPPEGLIL